ncbi:TatD family hydrolase [Microbacterium paludicola]|uniref:TatD family hydrolase n=1 Tax=Microbacterium paludicola TaxID=300019 RepID=UPI0021B64DF7|nr:TatD family hydrolase [Microbacterium paludicola]
MHAHLAADLSGADLRSLGAHIFAVTRSLEEYEQVAHRTDRRTLWGAGVHPGLMGSIKNFEPGAFQRALRSASFVGEIGLDGSSRVPMPEQKRVLRTMLEQLQDQPRIVSVHSAGAHFEILRELHRTPIDGVVLHWWTGSAELTAEAVRLGCYFSVPPAMISARATLAQIPAERMLFETDHPYGDRRLPKGARPGAVSAAEDGVAALSGRHPREVRIQSWRTFRTLLDKVDVRSSLGSEWLTVFDHLE